MSKLPAFQFYPGDWRKDPGVQALTFEERGVWLEILCLMHESERRGLLLLNRAAMPDEALANLLGMDINRLTLILTKLLTFGVASRETETGALMNRRMVRDEEIRKIRAEGGKKGGNPRLLNLVPNLSPNLNTSNQLNQKSTPSSSSSSSSSSSEETPIVPKGDERAKALEINRQVAEIYEAYPRKIAKGAAIKAIRKAFQKHSPEFLLAAVKRYAVARAGEDPNFTPYPATWFNREQFMDDPANWSRVEPTKEEPDFTF